MIPGLAMAAGGGLTGASSPGDIYTTPTVTVGGISSPLFGSKGLSGLDPMTLIVGGLVLGALAWYALKK